MGNQGKREASVHKTSATNNKSRQKINLASDFSSGIGSIKHREIGIGLLIKMKNAKTKKCTIMLSA